MQSRRRGRVSASGLASASPSLTFLAILLVAYLTLPVAGFLLRASRSPGDGFDSPGLWGALVTSIAAATAATCLVALAGIPLAHKLARSSGRLAAVVGIAVQLPLALPPVMSGIVLIYIAGPYSSLGRFFGGRLTDSLVGVIIAQSFVASPFLVISARSAFAATDPAVEDVAATLGLGPLARFLRVALPAAAPGIRAGMLLTWLRAFGEYGATVILAYHPYSLPVFTFVQFSGAGLPLTQAPTLLAIGVAVAAIVISRVSLLSPWPASLRDRRRGHRAAEGSRPPATPSPGKPGSTSAPVTVTFDLDVVLGDFRLQVAYGAVSHRLAILGPSGSGKSMTLRCLAGLLGPGVGSVSYGGQQVDSVATQDRRVGYVPQTPSLLATKTVWQQITLPLDTDPEVAIWWLHTLHLDGAGGRLPGELSGGQRQRVLIAQALSRQPRLLLLDEPSSWLDAPVRDEMRRAVRRLQLEAGLSTVVVTHDPVEAALLADEILVLADGRLLQAGPRAAVFEHPASLEVGRLLGVVNLHPGRACSSTEIAWGDSVIATNPHGCALNSEILWSVAPERLRLAPDRAPGTQARRARIVDVIDRGTSVAVDVRLDDGPDLQARCTDHPPLEPGDACWVEIPRRAVRVWELNQG